MISINYTKRIGRIAIGEHLWIFALILSLLLNIVECSAKSGQSGSANQFEDDEFAEFEEFDEEANAAPPADQLKRPSAGGGGSQQQQQQGGGGSKPGGGNAEGQQKKPEVDGDDFEELEEEKSSAGGREKLGQQKTPAVAEEEVVDEEADDLEGIVEEEVDDEYSHLRDGDEFENYDSDKASKAKQTSSPGGAKTGGVPDLKYTEVPARLLNNWSNFQVELLMLFGLGLYLMNYAYGKSKNHRLATTWFEVHREILQSNFEVVGDDGTTQEVQRNVLMKESDSSYSIWCTGRQGCQGMLVQLKFLKRQDIVSIVMQLFKPKYDKVLVKLTLSADDADTYVFAVGNKKTVSKLAKDMNDLCQFCTEKKNAERIGLPDEFAVFSEIGEATSSILDSKTLAVIKKYEEFIDYIHVSDQFSGPKPADGEAQTKLPDTSRVLIFSFNIPGKLRASEKEVEDMKPLLTLVFYCLDKIRRYRLTREGKQKADKNRLAAQESYLKQTHAQRQEAAQQRREEKVRERKEKLMAEEDPEKQKRMEKEEMKREMKKKQPKVKQLKIKAG